MIVKILSSTSTFNGVDYNTNKVDTGKGELMKINNMDFSEKEEISPTDVKAYFKAYSGTKIKDQQFHVALSCKGREMDKKELTAFAVKYMDGMGYGKQPYIVVFHNDTENNHVHIVSSRVDENGKKINNSFEKYRSLKIIRDLTENKEQKVSEKEKLGNLLKYSFSTEGQMKSLLEKNGFLVTEKEESFLIYKKGELLDSFKKNDLPFSERGEYNLKQTKALFSKYSKEHNTDLKPVYEKLKGDRNGKLIGYESDFTNFMKSKFGYDFVFHFSEEKKPFGYTVIDNKNKTVLKGSEVMKMSALLGNEAKKKKQERSSNRLDHINVSNRKHVQLLSKYYKVPEWQISQNGREVSKEDKEYTKAIIQTFLEKDNVNNLSKIGLIAFNIDNELFFLDKNFGNIYEGKDVIDEKYIDEILGISSIQEEKELVNDMSFGWSMASDVDDEKTHGKERSKKGKKR